jgi:nucleoid-associated protein EbfC
MMMNILDMMKQAQGLQARMQKMQEELSALQVDGQSGGGLVTVTMTGKFDMTAIRIDPSMVKPEDVTLLEDLILAACKDAKAKAEIAMQSRMAEATQGLPLPPGMKLF